MAKTIPIIPPTSSFPAAAFELEAAAALAALTLEPEDLDVVIDMDDIEVDVDEAEEGATDMEDDWTEMVGTPPEAIPAAPDAEGEVEFDTGIEGDPEPDPPTTAPIPH